MATSEPPPPKCVFYAHSFNTACIFTQIRPSHIKIWSNSTKVLDHNSKLSIAKSAFQSMYHSLLSDINIVLCIILCDIKSCKIIETLKIILLILTRFYKYENAAFIFLIFVCTMIANDILMLLFSLIPKATLYNQKTSCIIWDIRTLSLARLQAFHY